MNKSILIIITTFFLISNASLASVYDYSHANVVVCGELVYEPSKSEVEDDDRYAIVYNETAYFEMDSYNLTRKQRKSLAGLMDRAELEKKSVEICAEGIFVNWTRKQNFDGEVMVSIEEDIVLSKSKLVSKGSVTGSIKQKD